MGKLFGTDGIRGVVNAGLDAELAFKVGMAAARVLAKEKGADRPRFTIGKDTRISSDLLEGALVAGLCSAGADVLHLGVIPTPAVAWVTTDMGADAGIMVSASHNPFEHNGIKIFNGRGFKLSDSLEDEIEALILGNAPIPLKTHGEIGRVTHVHEKACLDYVDHLTSTVERDLAGLHILVDCANGASYATAPALFDRFDRLSTDCINADPDGVNINDRCGSTHLGRLKGMVTAGGYDLGVAFDGDADRCLMVDETGEEIDGDQVIAAIGLDLHKKGRLPGDTVVATVMSNIGLHNFAQENGLHVVCTNVGDRNVLEQMQAGGYVLGGEQSGHTIFLDHATTGDGELTALQFLELLHRSGKKASELVAGCRRYPQQLINVTVRDNSQKERIMSAPWLKEGVRAQEDRLGKKGRVLVRASGTEALVRVMVEAESDELALRCAEELVSLIKKHENEL